MESEDKSMTTLGEYRVGIAFNPSKDPVVNGIKRAAADLIDLVEDVATNGSGEVERLKALAMIHIEDGAMWAVKAATKSPQE